MRISTRFFAVANLLLAIVMLQACKHPLSIVGRGDIVDLKGSGHGCTLEQYQISYKACTENAVSGDYYVVYAAKPRPGWRFVRWEGPCSPKSNFQRCRLDVSAAEVRQWDEANPEAEIPPSVAVFQPITGETGYFIGAGSVVAGVAYQTPTQQGVTGLNGRFQYGEGEVVRFMVGDTVLGEIEGQSQVTPFDLAGSAVVTGTHAIEKALDNEHDPFHAVINITVLLRTLDHDANPDNGVKIRQSVAALLGGVSLDVSQHWETFSEEFEFRQAMGRANTNDLFSKPHGITKPESALDHLYATLEIDPEITAIILSERDVDGDGELDVVGSWQYEKNGFLTQWEGQAVLPHVGTGTSLYGMEYDSGGNLVGYTQEGLSCQSSRFIPSCESWVRWRYDNLGNLVEHDQATYSYNPEGRLVRTEFDEDNDGNPDFISLQCEYNNLGQLTMCGDTFDTDGTPRNVTLYEYDDQGKLTRYEEYSNERRTVKQRYKYDDRGNVTRVINPVRKDSLQYDENNNLTRHEVNKAPKKLPYGDGDRIYSWEYDTRGNLIHETTVNYRNIASPYTQKNIRYKYDDKGNMTSRKIGIFGPRERWQYDANNNITQYMHGDKVQIWEYDANNNITQYMHGDEVQIWEYDDFGNPTRRERITNNGRNVFTTAWHYEGTGWGHLFFNPVEIKELGLETSAALSGLFGISFIFNLSFNLPLPTPAYPASQRIPRNHVP